MTEEERERSQREMDLLKDDRGKRFGVSPDDQPNPSIALSTKFAQSNPEVVERLSKHQLFYSALGLVLGLACIVGGVVLFLNGVAGSTSWTAKMLGAESQITDAAPGAILFIVGLFVVVATRYVLKVR